MLHSQEPILTGTDEILSLLGAVAILAVGIFRFDWISTSKKRPVEPRPAARRAKRVIVEYHDEDDAESIESPHKQ